MKENILCENGTDVLMAFLYANKNYPILGFTKLDKLMWLLSKTKEFENLIDFEFDNDNYGPLSVDLYDTLKALISAGLVVIAHKFKPRNSIHTVDEALIESDVAEFEVSWKLFSLEAYKISQKGLVVAEALFKSLTDEQKRKLVSFKVDFGMLPLQHLLHCVYIKMGLRQLRAE